jgi:hypothetical protein
MTQPGRCRLVRYFAHRVRALEARVRPGCRDESPRYSDVNLVGGKVPCKCRRPASTRFCSPCGKTFPNWGAEPRLRLQQKIQHHLPRSAGSDNIQSQGEGHRQL